MGNHHPSEDCPWPWTIPEIQNSQGRSVQERKTLEGRLQEGSVAETLDQAGVTYLKGLDSLFAKHNHRPCLKN